MARSVVLKPSPRCPRCRTQPRWCICDGFQPVECPLQVDILMHHREVWKPTSTGHLINRILPASRSHVYRREKVPDPASIVQPGRTLWILHPNGDPLPPNTDPAGLQVLLLDGSWSETNGMLRAVGSWGRRISLPMAGDSRYWLRTQQEGNRFSTVEALLFLLAALGLQEAHDRLRLQFELHVYVGLCSRGKTAAARDFLASSPLPAAMPELLARLATGDRPPASDASGK